jgi:hypothetical protein
MANKKSLGIGSLRHMQIDKDNTYIVVAVAAAAACLIFALVSAQALWKQASYNRRVITKKEATRDILIENKSNLTQLKDSYKAFVENPTNILEGSSTGTGNNDGDNAKIILDAMPSVYDFPGMITGFNKILNTGEFNKITITASDEEVNQKANTTPGVVELPISFTVESKAEATQAFLTRLNSSIRPVKARSINFSGEAGGDMTVTFEGYTYYQPKKVFDVTTETVK